jgi:NitT/TauT family transport system permease protein
MANGGARGGRRAARFRRAIMFVLAFVLIVALWEGYKLVGPEHGAKIFGARLLPRASDSEMPHVWTMLQRFNRPEVRGNPRKIVQAVLSGAWFSFRVALAGLAVGVVVGLALAIAMARFQVLERGLLPYVILSQTVPLIALSPLVVSWGGRLHLWGFTWQRWMSAAVIGAFLAFFPVTVGALRGLQSPGAANIELMDSYAASWRQTLMKLRFPAAVPYLIPALKLAASAAVVGVIVAEISTALRGGVGRLIITYAQEATGDPAKVYTALFGAAAVGLAMAALVALLDRVVMRHRAGAEVAT